VDGGAPSAADGGVVVDGWARDGRQAGDALTLTRLKGRPEQRGGPMTVGATGSESRADGRGRGEGQRTDDARRREGQAANAGRWREVMGVTTASQGRWPTATGVKEEIEEKLL
jgi:hypothetical protein